MVNELRFGSVTALQEEILRLQQEVRLLQQGNRVVGDGKTLSAELSSCHKMCNEMCVSNASLWRELLSLQQAYSRLKNELKMIVNSVGKDDNEEMKPLIGLVHELVNKNCYSSTVLMSFLIDL